MPRTVHRNPRLGQCQTMRAGRVTRMYRTNESVLLTIGYHHRHECCDHDAYGREGPEPYGYQLELAPDVPQERQNDQSYLVLRHQTYTSVRPTVPLITIVDALPLVFWAVTLTVCPETASPAAKPWINMGAELSVVNRLVRVVSRVVST